MNKLESINIADSWYNENALTSDVVLSSRVRLARNLAIYPFPESSRKEDWEKVQSQVFNTFKYLDNSDNYHFIETQNLDSLGREVLFEKGLIDKPTGSALITTPNGSVYCNINSKDHVRLSMIKAGLSCSKIFSECNKLDKELQRDLQFAANYDFGFLTSSIFDVGSGLKASIRFHLPSTSFSGEIKNIITMVKQHGFSIRDVYGSGDIFDSSLGAYYEISTTQAFNGCELDQIADISALAKYIIDIERKIRATSADNNKTAIRNIIIRSYALAKFSLLINLREAIDIISSLKWGYDLGYIRGVNEADFLSLLYRIQNGHINFLLHTGTFTFDDDIQNKADYLRALILQKTVEKILFVS